MSSISRPTQRQLRTLQRTAHLVAGVVLLVYVYAAPALGLAFAAVVQWLVVPALVLSGMVMWKWPRIRAWLRRRRG